MRLLVLIGIATVYLAITSNAAGAGERLPTMKVEWTAKAPHRAALMDLETAAAQKKDAFDTVTRGAWGFAVNLYKNVSKAMDGSFVTAPLSLSVALAMATYGAKKNTKRDLLGVLGLSNAPDNTVVIGYEQLIKRIKDDKNSKLRVVNEVNALLDGPQLKDKFLKRNKEGVCAIRQTLGHHYTKYTWTRIVEQWIGNQRNEETLNIVGLSDITFNPMLVVASAFYFEGGWERHFAESLTERHRFWYKGMILGDTQMMYARRVYRYGNLPELKSRFVELPYQSNSTKNAVSMFIILPDKKDGLPYLEENLHKLSLNKLFPSNFKILDLYLPKFKVENYLWLEGILQTMGLTDMFTSAANFDRISEAHEFRGRAVGQAAVLDASPTGTNLGMSLWRLVPPEYSDLPGNEYFNTIHNSPIQFVAEHPFIALVTTRGENPVAVLTARFTGH